MVMPDQTPESLLKYKRPGLVGKNKFTSTRGHTVKFVDVPPKPKTDPNDLLKENTEDILNNHLPPRTWMKGNLRWVQPVSNAPGRTADVVNLKHLLDSKLQVKRAHAVGICPIRRALYTQCFDEIIRQVIVMCTERGQLLACIRDEIQMTIAAYKTLYQTSTAYGMRKALLAEKNKEQMDKQIPVLVQEIEELRMELSELTTKCDTIQESEKENREQIEKDLEAEIETLQTENQQLKDDLETIITSLRNS
ncbi:hypothetical protein JOB18_008709 [Solea senegalensis]|uniref:Axonemal dynein light intermediate polypeptide 1 n=1 Tax=Solea senegalensis TaxID=28829 RepID=A0AAV6PJZ5_SOLSE|nr:axonemal dynein light intermediate polypeptide 1-like [Solea senegalensis]KAG7465419.1 hypothetical protein JOB18_008709 [Solea senegalensis]